MFCTLNAIQSPTSTLKSRSQYCCPNTNSHLQAINQLQASKDLENQLNELLKLAPPIYYVLISEASERSTSHHEVTELQLGLRLLSHALDVGPIPCAYSIHMRCVDALHRSDAGFVAREVTQINRR